MRQATSTTEFVFDAVQLLFQDQLLAVSPMELKMVKEDTPFIQTSYEAFTR